ncbi:MAG: ArsR family transcriptional regulator [Rhodospirillaceae bacterium]|nr:MAG: ArsR family transcriptional regulator [Rhodospirillaceae bacterium]
MMNIKSALALVNDDGATSATAEEARLDLVFAALSDPIRRRVLQELDGRAQLVSELAALFDISLQGVSRHIQVLVRAGLVQQERSGRISRCSLDVGPLFDAALWLNHYSKYWQEQFGLMAAMLSEIDTRQGAAKSNKKRKPRKTTHPK